MSAPWKRNTAPQCLGEIAFNSRSQEAPQAPSNWSRRPHPETCCLKILLWVKLHWGGKLLTNCFCSSSLFLFQGVKYWELDHACSLCWPFFSCHMASSHMGSANQRGQTSLFSGQRHFYHHNQVISLYLRVWNRWDAASVLFWIPVMTYKCLYTHTQSD